MSKRLGREWTQLSGSTDASHVNAAPEANLLRLVREGTSISFYANGVLLGRVSDSSLSSGYVGVIAGEWQAPFNSHWVFDDFQVQALP